MEYTARYARYNDLTADFPSVNFGSERPGAEPTAPSSKGFQASSAYGPVPPPSPIEDMQERIREAKVKGTGNESKIVMDTLGEHPEMAKEIMIAGAKAMPNPAELVTLSAKLNSSPYFRAQKQQLDPKLFDGSNADLTSVGQYMTAALDGHSIVNNSLLPDHVDITHKQDKVNLRNVTAFNMTTNGNVEADENTKITQDAKVDPRLVKQGANVGEKAAGFILDGVISAMPSPFRA